MAGPFGSPFGNAFGSPFSNPFGSSTSSTPDEIFQKQMETMVNTLSKAGIDTKKVDQRTWLEKLFSVLNTPLAATTSMTSAAFGPKTLPEALGNIKDTWTGKKAYGTTELLNEAFGKDESFGRKAAAFGLGIPMDPLTWLPLGKIAGAVSKPLAKGIKAIPGGAGKLDELTDVASGVKKFFGYDDFARFRAMPEISHIDPITGKKVITQVAQADTKEAARTIKQLVQSNTARRGLNLDKYLEDEQFKGLMSLINPLDKDEKRQMLFLLESPGEVIAKASPVSNRANTAAYNFRLWMKKMGDEKVARGLIGDVGGKLPIRIGEESMGYVPHVGTKEFLKKYPSLDRVPEELQKFAAPLYEVGQKGVHSRKLPGTILSINEEIENKIGMKMFEEDPLKILFKDIEDMSQIKAQKDIVAAIRELTDSSGQKLIQSFDDETIADIAKKMTNKGFSMKGQVGAGTEIQNAMKEIFEEQGLKYDEIVKKLPRDFAPLSNPLFKEGGKITAARTEVAAIINKLSEQVPGESTNAAVRVTDKLTSLWKKLAITNPKFHINNWFGANINNLMDDFPGTIKNAPMVQKIMKGGSDEIFDLGSVKGTADQILDMFRKSGAVSGFTKAEAFTGKPLDIISKASIAIGGKIETQARLAAFVNNLKKGSSTSEALQRVFQIHGNYAPEAMSKFEKDVIKRVFPFYTWMKTSAPYQAQTLWNKTGIYSNLAHSQDIVKGDENQNIPDWLRQKILIGTKKTADGRSVARQLPMSAPDLEMLANPAQVMLSKLNPLLKIPIEVGQNKDVFFGNTIIDKNKYEDDGRRVGGGEQALDYALKQIPALTALKGSGLFPKSTSVVGKEGFAQAELASLGINEDVITRIMAAIAGQVDPTAPRIYDPAREQYAQQSVEAEMMRNLIGRLRRSGVIPPAK